jgi:hypothetical protein
MATSNLPAQGEKKQASKIEQADLQIAVKMGTKLLREAGGLKAIESALRGSGDPAQAIAKFLVQLIMQIKEAVEKQGVTLSPTIVLGEGGWVHQMLDVIEQELGLPPEFSDQVFGDVVETFKALAQGASQAGAGAATNGAPQATPGAPAPQGPVAAGGGGGY